MLNISIIDDIIAIFNFNRIEMARKRRGEFIVKIAICDDNYIEANHLRSIIENFMFDHKINAKIDIFTKSSNLLNMIDNYEIVVLDIVLGNKLGMDVAKSIHNIRPTILIIYYSSNMEYAPDTYESFGSGFISKPLDKVKVYKCLNRVIKNIESKFIKFKGINNISFEIYIYDIEYIKSEGKYTFVKFKNKKMKCRKLLKDWMNELDNNYFLLCKRGLLINANYVDSIDEFNYLKLNNGERIHLSVEVSTKFKQKLAQFWAENV